MMKLVITVDRYDDTEATSIFDLDIKDDCDINPFCNAMRNFMRTAKPEMLNCKYETVIQTDDKTGATTLYLSRLFKEEE